MSSGEWYRANRANWDERVPIHLKSYDLTALRSGNGRLFPVEESELRIQPGQRVLHLQCHFGEDTLTFAQRGAQVVGIDFSPAAIAAARDLAVELKLIDQATFLEANVYEAPSVFPEAGSFDLVFVSWGAINWLPDIQGWANVVSYYLRPGGRLYLAEGHPTAYVFEDAPGSEMPTWFAPYFHEQPSVIDDSRDYSDPNATLQNTRTYEWIHPLGSIVDALAKAGLRIEFLREHDSVPWRMFAQLVKGPDGLYRWPDKRWLPLSFSLSAMKLEYETL
jgi:SAM-dependent methyltransferase